MKEDEEEVRGRWEQETSCPLDLLSNLVVIPNDKSQILNEYK